MLFSLYGLVLIQQSVHGHAGHRHLSSCRASNKPFPFFLFAPCFLPHRFNPGSQLAIADSASMQIVARTAVTTTMGGAAGGFTMLMYKYMRTRVWDTLGVCNGALAGLVGGLGL